MTNIYSLVLDCYLTHKVLATEKDKLIVFAGSMYLTYGLGINMRFARMTNEPFVTILPQKNSVSEIPTGYSDFLFLY